MSNHRGEPSTPETNSYQAILDRMGGLIESGGQEAIDSFIDERLDSLTATADSTSVNMLYPIRRGFIAPDTSVKRSFMQLPELHLNDRAVYQGLFDQIIRFRKSPGWETQSMRTLVPTAIQYTIGEYFGNHFGEAESDQANRQFYFDEDSDVVNLSQLKGKRLAVCMEKAAVAQNLLSFTGMDCRLVMSNCYLRENQEKPELHVFNVFSTDKGNWIYDPTNPRLVMAADGSVLSVGAAAYHITNEQLHDILYTKNLVRVEHQDVTVDTDGRIATTEKSERIYGGAGQSVE